MKIEVVELWRIIYRRYIMISIITFVMVLVTCFVNFFIISPKYEAETAVMLNAQNSSEDIVYEELITSEKLLGTYIEIVKSNRVAGEVIKSLTLNYKPEELLEQLKVRGNNDSLITSIIVTDEDPAKAVEISNAFAYISIDTWQSVMKMDNVYILDEAMLGSDPVPVEPRPLFNIVFSFFLGLFLSIISAVFLEVLNNTLKTEEQIEQELQLSVLAVIPFVEQKGKKGFHTVKKRGGRHYE